MVQKRINGMLDGATPKTFDRRELLKTVAIHIATSDQVSISSSSSRQPDLHGKQSFEIANKPSFRNCLVMMRPGSTKEDLPSAHNIKVYLHKAFTAHVEELVKEIKAS